MMLLFSSLWPHTRFPTVPAPDALLADKAYDSDAIRDDLKTRGIKAVIPPKSNRKATIRYSKRLYRERNCIERVIGHL
jgi:transposase